MNYLDIVLGILLIISAINGFVKGFVEELAGLVALLLGIWAAIHFSDLIAKQLTAWFGWSFDQLPVMAFIITFILVVILVNIIGSLINKLVKAASLGFLNRLAGLGFGVIKGALILSIILVVFEKIDKNVHLLPESVREESRLYDPVMKLAPGIFPFLDFWGDQSENPEESPGKGNLL